MGSIPSLVDICINVAIRNTRHLGDVDGVEFALLDRILPHCTLEQLTHIEACTTGTDLNPITDKLWKNFFRLQFGQKCTDIVIERMKKKNVSFTWKKLYEAKLKDIALAEEKVGFKLKQLYKEEDARKQSRQICICSQVPPSGNKRGFDRGTGSNVSNAKKNLMKKSRKDFINSPEVKNHAVLMKNAVRRKYH